MLEINKASMRPISINWLKCLCPWWTKRPKTRPIQNVASMLVHYLTFFFHMNLHRSSPLSILWFPFHSKGNERLTYWHSYRVVRLNCLSTRPYGSPQFQDHMALATHTAACSNQNLPQEKSYNQYNCTQGKLKWSKLHHSMNSAQLSYTTSTGHTIKWISTEEIYVYKQTQSEEIISYSDVVKQMPCYQLHNNKKIFFKNPPINKCTYKSAALIHFIF